MPNEFSFEPLVRPLLPQIHPHFVPIAPWILTVAVQLLNPPLAEPDAQITLPLQANAFIESLQNRRIPGCSVRLHQRQRLGRLGVRKRIKRRWSCQPIGQRANGEEKEDAVMKSFRQRQRMRLNVNGSNSGGLPSITLIGCTGRQPKHNGCRE